MTGATGTNPSEYVQPGAPTHLFESGGHFYWLHLEKQVKRHQERIAKATREGRWNRVKALQRLLTRSFAAKAFG